MPDYRLCGLAVASAFELPGIAGLAPDSGAADIAIRLRPVPAQLEAPIRRLPAWEYDARHFLLTIAGLCRFMASDGRTLDVEPLENAALADILPFLLGSGIGALHYQRGGLVLHAATLVDQGRAYAFCGSSGEGKSTLAAALCRAGCRFLSDDITALDLSGPTPLAWPDGRRLKLHQASIDHLGLQAWRAEAVRAAIEKYHVELPDQTQEERSPLALINQGSPLAGIYLLKSGPADQPVTLEALPAWAALQPLFGEIYRPRIAEALLPPGAPMMLAAKLLRHVPVFRLTRPRGLGALDATLAQLLARWR